MNLSACKVSPLRICVVGYGPSLHVQTRAKCFAERGHTVILVTPIAAGIEGIREVVPPSPSNPVLLAFSRFIGFARAIRESHADIVHVHYAQGMAAWVAGLVDFHPLVVSVMGGDVLFDEQGKPSRFSRKLTARLLKAADLITVKSDFLAGVVLDLVGHANLMKVVWGVDLKLFHRVERGEMRRRLGLAEDDQVIVSPKMLQPFYNIHLIVEAMPRVVAAHPKVRLVIPRYQADADYESRIIALVDRLGLGQNVVLTDPVAHQEMPCFYSLADLAVAVPPSDGIPQSLLEAMACGLPHVLSDLPRYREIVHHADSAYFVKASPDCIAEGICRLLEDEDLRATISRNGVAIVRASANLGAEVARVEEAYYGLVAGPRRRTLVWDRAIMAGLLIGYMCLDRVPRLATSGLKRSLAGNRDDAAAVEPES